MPDGTDSGGLRFGVQIRPGPVPELVHQAVLCEKLGFDSVWWMDHFIASPATTVWPELYTSLAIIAYNTTKVQIGSAVTDALRRHPAAVAQSLATVDQVSAGRAILGLGAGEAMNLIPFGLPMTNLVARLREAITIIRLLWKADGEKPANFLGNFYLLERAYLQAKPVRLPCPPIYLGAFGPRMLEMTGELADGWLPWSHTPETYRRALQGPVAVGLKKGKRALSELETCSINIASVSRNRDEAAAAATQPAKQMLALVPQVLNLLAPEIKHPSLDGDSVRFLGPAPNTPESQVLAQVIAEVSPEVALRTAIWGSPDDCIGQIEKLAGAGCRHFVLSTRGSPRDRVLSMFAADVLPYFRKHSD